MPAAALLWRLKLKETLCSVAQMVWLAGWSRLTVCLGTMVRVAVWVSVSAQLPAPALAVTMNEREPGAPAQERA